MAKPTIEPITDATLPEFAAFLETHMPAQRTASDWICGLSTGWGGTRPNYGFLMRDQGEVVGGIGVSSGTPAQDQDVAQAGIDHWNGSR